MQLKQQGAECLRIFTLQFGGDFRSDVSKEIVWQRRPHQLATSYHFISSSVGTDRMLFTYHLCPPLRQNFLGRTQAATDTFTLDMLINVWNELEYRYGMCWATHGAVNEHL